jgi:hypothetical protein
MVKVYNPAGLKQRAAGRFTIEQVHQNPHDRTYAQHIIYEQINIHQVPKRKQGGSVTYLSLDVDRSGLIRGSQIHDSAQELNLG